MRRIRFGKLTTSAALLLAIAACSSSDEADTVGAVITLVNGSDVPVWVQAGTGAWQPEWGVISNADGPLRTELGCDCDCETGSCGNDCPAAPSPQAQELVPQEYLERTWNGTFYVEDAANDCVTRHQAEIGQPFSVEFCWGASYALDGAGPATVITNTECAERDFTASRSQTLRHAAQVAKLSEEVTFIIENGHTVPIYVQEQDGCVTDPAWFGVSFQDEPLVLFESCGLCPCDETNCTDECTTACAVPRVVELAPGETIEHVWDGYHYLIRTSPECEQDAAAPRGPLVVELCWGTSATISQSEEHVDSPVCSLQTFRLGEATEVRLVAAP